MKAYTLIAVLFALILSACGSTSTLSDAYGDFDLTEYQSFDFYSIEGPAERTEDYEENIKLLQEVIGNQMISRGLTQNSTSPDLKINLGIIVEDKVQTRTTSLATDPFMYSGQRSYTWESREVPVNTYKEGTLTLHLVDSKSNAAVWAGTASRVLQKKNEKRQKAAQEAIEELFDQIDN